MRYPTASQLERALACPASHVLPKTYDSSPYAEAGQNLHAALQAHVEGRPYPSELRAWAESAVEEAGGILSPDSGVVAEAAYCLDAEWVAGEYLGRNLGRNYGTATSRGYCGSADYVRRTPSGVVQVLDLKTGFGEVTPARRNAQLLMLACAAVDHHEGNCVEVGLLFAPSEGSPRMEWESVPEDELHAFRERLRGLTATLRECDAQRGTAQVNAGAWCRYCKARAACPEMAKREADALALPKTARLEVTAANAGEVWAAVDRAREVLDELKTACIRVALAEGGVRMPDGRTRRQVSREVSTWDASVAWQVLSARYGPEVARAAMTLETSRAGIERGVAAAKTMGAEGTKASLVREVLEAVEKAGGKGSKARTEWVDE